MKRSTSSHILIILLIFLAIGALPAGLILMFDPSGDTMGFPPTLLEQLRKSSPFSNFLIPGAFLFLALGVVPALAAYGFITKAKMMGMKAIAPHRHHLWSWTVSYYTGLLLILWITMQLLFGIGFGYLHFTYILLGVVIVIVAQLPETRRTFFIEPRR